MQRVRRNAGRQAVVIVDKRRAFEAYDDGLAFDHATGIRIGAKTAIFHIAEQHGRTPLWLGKPGKLVLLRYICVKGCSGKNAPFIFSLPCHIVVLTSPALFILC